MTNGIKLQSYLSGTNAVIWFEPVIFVSRTVTRLSISFSSIFHLMALGDSNVVTGPSWYFSVGDMMAEADLYSYSSSPSHNYLSFCIITIIKISPEIMNSMASSIVCQLPNPKGLGRPLHRRSIVTCGCTGAIYCHRNTTLPIIFREYSRRFQGARFICALKGRRVLYPLTRAN